MSSHVQSDQHSRNDTIELLRIVAICGVVWFHLDTTPYKRVGYSGLVFFLIVSVVFQKNTAEKTTSHDFFRKRSSRLLIPWAAWFVLYGLLNIVMGKPLFPYTSGLIQNILGGPWIGLWYLPFSFLSAFLVYGLVQSLARIRTQFHFTFWAIASFITLLCVALARTWGIIVNPWAQWLQAAPSIPIGLAMAYILTGNSRIVKIAIVYELVLLGICMLIYRFDPALAISYAIGSFLVIGGLIFKRQLSPVIGHTSVLCLGVYLIHGLVMSGFKMVPWVTQRYLPWFILTTLISFAATAVIRRLPYLKEIV